LPLTYKEAKLLEKEGKKHDKESKLLETYKALLMTDTSQMHEDMITEHMLALKGTREMIFPTVLLDSRRYVFQIFIVRYTYQFSGFSDY